MVERNQSNQVSSDPEKVNIGLKVNINIEKQRKGGPFRRLRDPRRGT